MIRIFLFDQRLPCSIDPIRFGKAEAKRIEAIKNPKRKLESLCALAALDELLKISHMDFPIEISRDKNGKPYFKNSDISFSLSHSGDISVAVICDEKDNIIGVDIEKIADRSNFEELAERFFNDTEKFEFSKSGGALKSFFEIWTKKEAYAKMTGNGLSELFKNPTSDIGKEATTFCYGFYNNSDEYSLSICNFRNADDVEFYNNSKSIKIQKK